MPRISSTPQPRASQDPSRKTPTVDPGAQVLDLTKRYKMFSGNEIDKLARFAATSMRPLIDGLLLPCTVNIMAGNLPLGFERCAVPPGPLGHQQRDEVFRRLAASFRTAEVRMQPRRASEATDAFLQKLVARGLIRKQAHGRYVKAQFAQNQDFGAISSETNGLAIQ